MRSCFTNICNPVSQIYAILQIYVPKIYAIRCHKYMRCYKYMRSCFTNICDPVSQIYAMLQIYAILFHKYMLSVVTNICDAIKICDPVSQIYAIRCHKCHKYIYGIVFHKYMRPVQLTLGAPGPSTREAGPNGSSQISTSQRLPNFKTIFLRILCISQKHLTDLCHVRKLLQCAFLTSFPSNRMRLFVFNIEIIDREILKTKQPRYVHKQTDRQTDRLVYCICCENYKLNNGKLTTHAFLLLN